MTYNTADPAATDIGAETQENVLPNLSISLQSKKKGKDQESIDSSTTPDPGYQWESDNFTNTKS